MPDPIWDYEALAPVVAAADKAGLQVALHAIGDAAVRAASTPSRTPTAMNGGEPHQRRRHRIEHIEYCDPADIPRFAELGVTASMQPVHADPAIQDNWRAMLGPKRSPAGFPAAALVASGARLVLGTDARRRPSRRCRTCSSRRRVALPWTLSSSPTSPRTPCRSRMR